MGWNKAAFALAPVVLFAAACAAQPARDVVVEIPCDAFSSQHGDQVKVIRDATVAKGRNIVLRLCANPSTGFAWEEAQLSTHTVLAERSREFIPPGVTMPGGAGLEQWVFEAIDRGACSVVLSYSRPWDGGEKGVWLFELQVTVE